MLSAPQRKTFTAVRCLPERRAGKCIMCGITYKRADGRTGYICGRFVNADGDGPADAFACDHCISICAHRGDCPECGTAPPSPAPEVVG